MKTILESTRDFEVWLGSQIDLVPADLDYKHQQMKTGAFAFLRSTYYRWAETWEQYCPELGNSPTILAVGDLHVENFGTWRDAEGRLIWGVNDFDEAERMPYALDLARMGVSAALSIEASHLDLELNATCLAILSGYREALSSGGKPFVLAENHDWLRRLALGKLRNPVKFWQKLSSLPEAEGIVPESAKLELRQMIPNVDLEHNLLARRSGLGSLGRQRFVALANWQGGKLAREVKAFVPSGWLWANPHTQQNRHSYQTLADNAVRCHDPFLRIHENWIGRRLAPDCCRVELGALPDNTTAMKLLYAMGFEAANIHLASPDMRKTLLEDLEKRGEVKWLFDAVSKMTEATNRDFKEFELGFERTE